jgi:hypothetical protein
MNASLFHPEQPDESANSISRGAIPGTEGEGSLPLPPPLPTPTPKLATRKRVISAVTAESVPTPALVPRGRPATDTPKGRSVSVYFRDPLLAQAFSGLCQKNGNSVSRVVESFARALVTAAATEACKDSLSIPVSLEVRL